MAKEGDFSLFSPNAEPLPEPDAPSTVRSLALDLKFIRDDEFISPWDWFPRSTKLPGPHFEREVTLEHCNRALTFLDTKPYQAGEKGRVPILRKDASKVTARKLAWPKEPKLYAAAFALAIPLQMSLDEKIAFSVAHDTPEYAYWAERTSNEFKRRIKKWCDPVARHRLDGYEEVEKKWSAILQEQQRKIATARAALNAAIEDYEKAIQERKVELNTFTL